jgi:hypothetical protein
MTSLRLPRGRQAFVAGHAIGIHAMSPDPADPAARVGVGRNGPQGENGDEGPKVFLVRVGDLIDVGDLVLRTTNVVIGDHGLVEFDIVKPAEQ